MNELRKIDLHIKQTELETGISQIIYQGKALRIQNDTMCSLTYTCKDRRNNDDPEFRSCGYKRRKHRHQLRRHSLGSGDGEFGNRYIVSKMELSA
jgi:hypothetical protein